TVAGADLVIHSTHKTLGSLTQSSLLHFRERVVDIWRLTQYLHMLQSSSPSALLLLSLDLACAHMAGEGRGLLDQAVRLAFHAREQINMIEGLWCYGDEMVGRYGVDSYDSTKLVIDLRGIRVGGFAAASWLRDRHRIGVELADLHRIVCSVTIGDTEATVAELIAALRSLAKHAQPHETKHVPPQGVQLPGVPGMALSPRQASLAAWTVRPLEQARGGISAEFIIPYPPAIPMIVPGEIISAELISTIAELKRHGHRIIGPSDASLRTVRLLKTDS
ncbi:MAG TPA: hypothetical protein VEZ12_01320, partial [Herpetosiphonaceae bacterium]|nr:hypothetical protein [Herpetosiphonaceae bacterium]